MHTDRAETAAGRAPLASAVALEELTPALREVAERQRERQGFVSNSMRTLARSPDLALACRAFFDAAMQAGSLPKALRLLIRQRVSNLNACLYCSTHQLKHLASLGVDEAKVAHLADHATHPAFDDAERAALAYAECLTRDSASVPDAVVDELCRHFDEAARVEITVVAAAMGALNRINDGLRVPLEPFNLELASLAEPGLQRARGRPGG